GRRLQIQDGLAERQQKLGVVLHLTGCPINGSHHVLRTYARLGVRAIHPFIREDTFGGDWSRHGNQGLIKAGRALLREMEDLNVIMDTAHATDKTFSDVLRAARKPIIDSHVGCRSILNSKRNRTDRQLEAIGEAGGVVGVHFDSKLLAPVEEVDRTAMMKKLQRDVAEMRRKYTDPYVFMAKRYDPYRWSRILGGAIDDGIEPARAKLEDAVDHIDHMAQVAGAEHVCIGSDYALGTICGGVETADRLPNLAAALRDRGYRGAALSNILYGNVRRILMSALPSA
ncbi:MAG: dipeptidase, partial [bacterium]